MLTKEKTTFKDFVIKKDKTKSSTASLVELLKGHEVKALVVEYFKQGFTDFVSSKGTSITRTWTVANKDSILKLQNVGAECQTITALLDKASNVSDMPTEVSALFNNTYLPAANALDVINDYYQNNKKEQKNIGKEKQQTIEKIKKYSNISQSIKFISKDQSGTMILTLTIEQ